MIRFQSLVILTFLFSLKISAQDKSIFETVMDGEIATDAGESRGVAWGDYDNDGDQDLYVANTGGQVNVFYQNEGNGKFTKVSELSSGGLASVVYRGDNSQGVNWVDVDNDGFLDLFVVSRGNDPSRLFRNIGGERFEMLTSGPLVEDSVSASVACWADIEGDGDLDVFLVGYRSNPNVVYENLGSMSFRWVSNSPLNSGRGEARACACGDVNGDRLPEFYVANARQPNLYFINRGNWEFERIKEGHVATDVGYSYGVSFADYDDDGDLDLFVANFDKVNALYKNDGHGNLDLIKEGNIVTETGGASKGHSWGDYDNDGDLDLYIGNGTYGPNMQNFFYLNKGDGTFSRKFGEEAVNHADTSAGVAHGDYDNDGDLDLFVANWGGSNEINKFYVNQTSGKNWIKLLLRGTDSNRFAVGSKVELSVTRNGVPYHMYRWIYPVTGYGSQNSYEVHFGLGDIRNVELISITWPSGQVNSHENLQVNRSYVVEESGEIVERD